MKINRTNNSYVNSKGLILFNYNYVSNKILLTTPFFPRTLSFSSDSESLSELNRRLVKLYTTMYDDTNQLDLAVSEIINIYQNILADNGE
jgi:hypothetical protein